MPKFVTVIHHGEIMNKQEGQARLPGPMTAIGSWALGTKETFLTVYEKTSAKGDCLPEREVFLIAYGAGEPPRPWTALGLGRPGPWPPWALALGPWA